MTKINKENWSVIGEEYKSGTHQREIAEKWQVSENTVWRILSSQGLLKGRYWLTEKDKEEIVLLYQEGKTSSEISKITGIKTYTINNLLLKVNLRQRDLKNGVTHSFTQEDKEEMKRLYLEEKVGKQGIGKIYGCSDGCVSYTLKAMGVKTLSRSIIQKTWADKHGPTKGFGGRSHTQESKNKTSKALIDSFESGKRTYSPNGSKSYQTIYGKVQGTYEVAYLQKLKNQGKNMPLCCNKRLKTPFGTYLPDFEFGDKYIDVKSNYTLKMCKGEIPELFGKEKKHAQMTKIKHVSAHIKKVEIVVMADKEASILFKEASKEGGVLLLNTSA